MILEDIIGSLDATDKAVTLALNFDGGGVADTFFHTVSCSFSWIPFTLLFLYIIYKDSGGDWKRLCLILLGLVITVTLCDRISSGIIKPLVMRPRPSHNLYMCNLLHYVNGYKGGHYGFVSSHAANAFGAVVYCCMIVKRKWFTAVATSFAIIVCYSRIYLGVHYLGDVFCGALLGITVGITIYVLTVNIKFLHITKIQLPMKKVACICTLFIMCLSAKAEDSISVVNHDTIGYETEFKQESLYKMLYTGVPLIVGGNNRWNATILCLHIAAIVVSG